MKSLTARSLFKKKASKYTKEEIAAARTAERAAYKAIREARKILYGNRPRYRRHSELASKKDVVRVALEVARVGRRFVDHVNKITARVRKLEKKR